MSRPLLVLLPAVLLAACGQPAPTPSQAENAAGQGFDNAQVSQSIMQPKVIAEIAPAPTPTPESPPPPSGATVLFTQGSRLDDTGRGVVDALLAAPNLPPDAEWVLRGSSDSPGSDQVNLVTSRRRAEAVRAYLIEKGIADDRISVIALGEGRPVAPNTTLFGGDDPTGRARNRRVDIELVSAPPAPAPTAAPSPD